MLHDSQLSPVRFRSLAGLVLTASLLAAPTCNQPFGPTSTGAGEAKTYSAFGDSIAAGYTDGLFPGQIKSYVGYYADSAATALDWKVTYRGFTTSGETIKQIKNRMQTRLGDLRAADVFTWTAGGNDLLTARNNYRQNCNLQQLETAMDNWKRDWDTIVDLVEEEVGTETQDLPVIRTMNIYYPFVNSDSAGGCPGQGSYLEVLLPHFLAVADYSCHSVEARGWRCADTLAAMNCDEDESGNPEFSCPNKRYLQDLAVSGTCPRDQQNDKYRELSIAPTCIGTHLDATGDWSSLRSGTSVKKGGLTVNLLQSNDSHPNTAGHKRIGLAHHGAGYDDVVGPQSEGSYPQCTDGDDNDDDGEVDCEDDDCRDYCP